MKTASLVTRDCGISLRSNDADSSEALIASLDGDPKPLEEQKAELDKRTKKITEWLAEAKTEVKKR